MALRVDALRVVQDPAYAAALSGEQWRLLISDPVWNQLVSEHHELVAPVLARYGAELGLPEPTGVRPDVAVANPWPAKQYRVIGKPAARLHGIGVVTSTGQYTQNMRMPGMLHMRTLRSPHAHAKIKSIDISKAKALPGVVAILHRSNLPAEYRDVQFGSGPPYRYLFNEEMFEAGSPVAVVAAERDHIADEAIHLIEVNYEILPAVLDMMEGIKPSTPKQWDNRETGTIVGITPPLVRGTPEAATAEVNVEAVLTKSTEQHVALELSNCLMHWDEDRLIAYYTTQYAHGCRAGLAKALKIPLNRVRFIQVGYMGSGYGYRSSVDLSEVHAAILAKITGRPVKNMNTRAEDFVTRTHRPECRNEMKLGVNRDGTLQYGRFRIYANVGAQRAAAANGSWFNMQNLYKFPNLKLEGIDVFTNSYKAGAYRCVGHPNGTFALEMIVERAAYAVGMDPVEFRLKNLNEVGNPDTRKPFSNPGMRDCIVAASERVGWKQKWHAPRARQVRPGVFHGIGLAAHACSHGAGTDPATGQVIVNTDGSVQCLSGTTEIGGGQRTEMAMIAAEALGVPLNRVSITTQVDTDSTTDTGVTGGSRQTNSGGRGMYEAAIDAKRQILTYAAQSFVQSARRRQQTLQLTPDELDIEDGEIFIKATPSTRMRIEEVVGTIGMPILGRAIYRMDHDWERTAWAAHATEVEVDTGVGAIRITRYVAVHDVGQAINRLAVEQQIEGGVVMALGAVFTEELLVDGSMGLSLNPNMLDYRPLSIGDVPENIEVILIERPKQYGVFGAHGVGEPPMGPPAPAIAAAVYNAVGVWMDNMPISREKLLAALKGR